MPLLLSF
jgi:hypothetical protein